VSKPDLVSLEDLFVCQSGFISGAITQSKLKPKELESRREL